MLMHGITCAINMFVKILQTMLEHSLEKYVNVELLISVRLVFDLRFLVLTQRKFHLAAALSAHLECHAILFDKTTNEIK